MSINATTLDGAITFDATKVRVASGTGAVVGKFLVVDNEKMLIQDITLSPVLKVARGQNGTASLAHATGTPAYIGLPSDFPPIAEPNVYTYGAAGAIDPKPGLHRLNTGTAGAMTLRAPTKDEDGMAMTIAALTAHAYTVTQTTPGFNNGGTASDVATFGGAIGDSMDVIASNGVWLAVNLTGVTLG